MTAVLWLLPVVVPLTAAALAVVTRWQRSAVVVAAPLPALLLAIVGPPTRTPDLSWLLLDVTLALDPVARALLAMTGVVWVVAAVHGRALTADSAGFAGLFLLTLTGNVGALLAGDVVSFYAAFALLSFSAYGLVIHDRSPFARRASRVYLVLVVAAEVLLLAGFTVAVAAAGSIQFAEVGPAIAGARDRDLVLLLLVAGFGLKAGVIPLHVWLPLAHPAAPVPASAILSGAIIKIGMVGWLRVLPLGEGDARPWAVTLLVIGFASMAYATVVGVLQNEPKTVLAYSSIGQMGAIAVGVGLGLSAPGLTPRALTATTVYAVHHGVTKAALFLGVGSLVAARSSRGRPVVLAGLVLAGLSLAGLPPTSGWVAKLVLKDLGDAATRAGGIGGLPVGLLLSLGALGTVLLLARLLSLVLQQSGHLPADIVGTAAALGLTVAGLVAGWIATGPPWQPDATVGDVWHGVWPVLAGGVIAAAVALRTRHRARSWPRVPAGDVVVLGERAGAAIARALVSARGRTQLVGPRQVLVRFGDLVRPGAGMDAVGERLTRWRAAGAWFVGLAAALVVLFVRLGD